jgi:hypothetical protein
MLPSASFTDSTLYRKLQSRVFGLWSARWRVIYSTTKNQNYARLDFENDMCLDLALRENYHKFPTLYRKLQSYIFGLWSAYWRVICSTTKNQNYVYLDFENDMRLDLALRENYHKFPALFHIRNIKSFHTTGEHPDLILLSQHPSIMSEQLLRYFIILSME